MTGKAAKIRLLACELVTAHGTRQITWLVHRDGQWQGAHKIPGVRLERLDPGPGTIWETAAELEVEVGTWVQRVELSPLAEHFSDPMRYLEREVRGARRQVKRQYFIVKSDGTLLRKPKR